MPRVVQGVSARQDGIAGFVPVYARCNGMGIDDSARPVSSKAEMVTSGRSWKYYVIYFSFVAVVTGDLPSEAVVHRHQTRDPQ